MSSTWTVPSYGDAWTVPGYTEERIIGRGASGRVARATNVDSRQRVAIKYLSRMLIGDPTFMWGFRSEVQMLRELGVPQVVQVYDYVEQPGQGAAIVMELVDGVSLHEMIDRRGPTGPEAALTVLKDSLLGLSAAHTLGVVHRDYKPENVLVDASGNSKVADFGVAVRWGRQAPAAGTPLYMAPEEWHGSPASPATDVYAATAVFYECLTGKTPFSGKLPELCEQHVTAPVPLEPIDPPLREFIARGMAKNPAERPPSAIEFVSELEALASATYGPDWEEQGRRRLAERAATLLPQLLRDGRPSTSARSYASTWEGGRRKGLMTLAAVAGVIVLVLGAAAGAVALKGNNQTALSDVSAQAASFSATANVTPPVVASTCATATTFAYSATLTAYAPGTLKYQWVYSSGRPGPVQTVSFTEPGKRTVTGEKLSIKKAGRGWGEIKMISPAAQVLDKATYQLVCGKNDGQIVANSWIPVAPSTGICGTVLPSFTAAGNIWDGKAGTVTYHWVLSDGTTTAPETLTFKKARTTLTVNPVTITQTGAGSGSAVLVVTKPVVYSSSPAAYTQSCDLAAPSATSQASTPPAATPPVTSPTPTPKKTSPTLTPTTSSPTPTSATSTPTLTPTTSSPTPTPTTAPPTTAPPTSAPPTPTPTPTTSSPTSAPTPTPSTTTSAGPIPSLSLLGILGL